MLWGSAFVYGCVDIDRRCASMLPIRIYTILISNMIN